MRVIPAVGVALWLVTASAALNAEGVITTATNSPDSSRGIRVATYNVENYLTMPRRIVFGKMLLSHRLPRGGLPPIRSTISPSDGTT